ncbi:hypothetical protein AB1286_09120 [Trinickia sp. NRRL B-1857]|uniref:hypothetical protein n=1 Tax=Trinickia sp. NRRL B-1857 TaxID=3162879 RepID=UPI003D2C5B5F
MDSVSLPEGIAPISADRNAFGGEAVDPKYYRKRVKSSRSNTIYLILNGIPRPFPDSQTYYNLFSSMNDVIVNDVLVGSFIPGNPITPGAIFVNANEDDIFYLLVDNLLCSIAVYPVGGEYSFDLNKTVFVPRAVLDAISLGPAIT